MPRDPPVMMTVLFVMFMVLLPSIRGTGRTLC